MANEILKTSHAVFPIVFFTFSYNSRNTKEQVNCKSFNVIMSALFLFKRKK